VQDFPNKPEVSLTGRRHQLAQARGRWAEDQALEFLGAQGLRLCARNVRFRLGELDLIMWDQETLVFIEVRWRKAGRFLTAAGSVDQMKQRRILKSAQLWLMQRHRPWPACRFDVVALGPSGLEWIQGAFGQPGLL